MPSAPVVLKRVYTDYDFDATMQNYSTAGDPALGIARAYHSESIKQGTTFNNPTGYSKPEVDELFNKGRDGANQQARQEAYFRVQEILAQDLPILLVHQQAQIGASGPRLKGMWQAASYQWWHRAWVTK